MASPWYRWQPAPSVAQSSAPAPLTDFGVWQSLRDHGIAADAVPKMPSRSRPLRINRLEVRPAR